MNRGVGIAVLVAACGGSQTAKPLEGNAEATATIPALDEQLARLEAMRPYVVIQDDVAGCAPYTADASAALNRIREQTTVAQTARTSSTPDEVTAWQAAHRDALEKVLADIVLPTRMVSGCPAMEKDETWRTLSGGLVSIAQPPSPPPAVTRRREAMQALSALSKKLTAKEDCHQINDLLDGTYKDVDSQLKAMSKIEAFIDDAVWEEEDERRFEADEDILKMMSLCGGA